MPSKALPKNGRRIQPRGAAVIPPAPPTIAGGVPRSRETFMLPERTLIREHLLEQIAGTFEEVEEQIQQKGLHRVPVAMAIAHRLICDALFESNVFARRGAASEIMNRTEGKSTLRIEARQAISEADAAVIMRLDERL